VKIVPFSRYALSLSAAATLLAGCGGSQPPIGAPGAMPQTSALGAYADRGTSWMLREAIAEHVRRPVAHPTVLDFFSKHPLKFTVHQTGYYGRLTMSDSDCAYIASVSPKWAKGPRAMFKVTPIETPSGGTCVVSVADSQKYTAKVTVNNPGY